MDTSKEEVVIKLEKWCSSTVTVVSWLKGNRLLFARTTANGPDPFLNVMTFFFIFSSF